MVPYRALSYIDIIAGMRIAWLIINAESLRGNNALNGEI